MSPWCTFTHLQESLFCICFLTQSSITQPSQQTDTMHKAPCVTQAGPLCPGPSFPCGLQPREPATLCLTSPLQNMRPSGSLATFLSYFSFRFRDTRKSPSSPMPLWSHLAPYCNISSPVPPPPPVPAVMAQGTHIRAPDTKQQGPFCCQLPKPLEGVGSYPLELTYPLGRGGVGSRAPS